jgi:hypothetical protein
MSSRFGWIVIGKNLKFEEEAIVSRFRGYDPVIITVKHATEYLMCKVDDDYELCIGFGKNFTLIQGQYDLGINIWEDIDSILQTYSKGTVAIYIGIEGTSGSELYRKYSNGQLRQSFASYEGEISPDECFGDLPEADNEFGQIDEWSLIGEIEKEGIMYDEISSISLTIRNYSMAQTNYPVMHEDRSKTWWKFWK